MLVRLWLRSLPVNPCGRDPAEKFQLATFVRNLTLQLRSWLSLQTVQYQIVPGQIILYDQFTDGQTLPTLAGESLSVRRDDALALPGSSAGWDDAVSEC